MTEIDKMFKNAGINKSCHANIIFDDCIRSPLDCGYYNYPDFTTEKQLELIKWLGKLDMLEIMRTTGEKKAWIINSEYGMSGNVYKHTSRKKSFEEALAYLINGIWQSLTDQEKEEIRRILNE